MKCPKCGSTEVEKTSGVEVDRGDPSTIILSEEIGKWGKEAYTIRCKKCGHIIESDIVQPGYRD